jgi:hypothetical protein
MINIFFVPGMFGSTIEFIIKNFSNEFSSEYEDLNNYILEDGSLHSFSKGFHPHSLDTLKELASMPSTKNCVNTPMYPIPDANFNEIIKTVVSDDFLLNKNILIHSPNETASELNMFFLYYKIAIGTKKHRDGLGVFFNAKDANKNIANWNKDYNNWQDMKTWELREWFSMFYNSWLSQWIDSGKEVPNSFLKLPNTGMLDNPKQFMDTIFSHCELTWNNKDIDNFLNIWHNKQNVIVNKFNECNSILNNIINNVDSSWNKLDFIQEVVIQKKIRDYGYEIKCWGLDEFPTNTKHLYKLLEKV